MSDYQLTDLVKHRQSLEEITLNNKLKTEAAMNEDFELAIEYKKKIALLEKQLISEDDFEQRFWDNKPVLTEFELYLKLAEIDATFAKNFSDKKFALGKTKT